MYAALGLVHRNTCCRQQTLGTTSCSQGLLGRSLLNIYDIMLAHIVSAYIATRKWRVLKVTPRWQHRGRSLQSMTALFEHVIFSKSASFVNCVKVKMIVLCVPLLFPSVL